MRKLFAEAHQIVAEARVKQQELSRKHTMPRRLNAYDHLVEGINTLNEAANGIEKSIAALSTYSRP